MIRRFAQTAMQDALQRVNTGNCFRIPGAGAMAERVAAYATRNPDYLGVQLASQLVLDDDEVDRISAFWLDRPKGELTGLLEVVRGWRAREKSRPSARAMLGKVLAACLVEPESVRELHTDARLAARHQLAACLVEPESVRWTECLDRAGIAAESIEACETAVQRLREVRALCERLIFLHAPGIFAPAPFLREQPGNTANQKLARVFLTMLSRQIPAGNPEALWLSADTFSLALLEEGFSFDWAELLRRIFLREELYLDDCREDSVIPPEPPRSSSVAHTIESVLGGIEEPGERSWGEWLAVVGQADESVWTQAIHETILEERSNFANRVMPSQRYLFPKVEALANAWEAQCLCGTTRAQCVLRSPHTTGDADFHSLRAGTGQEWIYQAPLNSAVAWDASRLSEALVGPWMRDAEQHEFSEALMIATPDPGYAAQLVLALDEAWPRLRRRRRIDRVREAFLRRVGLTQVLEGGPSPLPSTSALCEFCAEDDDVDDGLRVEFARLHAGFLRGCSCKACRRRAHQWVGWYGECPEWFEDVLLGAHDAFDDDNAPSTLIVDLGSRSEEIAGRVFIQAASNEGEGDITRMTYELLRCELDKFDALGPGARR